MHIIQKIGLAVFILGLLLFTASLGINNFRLTKDSLRVDTEYHREAILEAAEEQGLLGEVHQSSFTFAPAFKEALKKAQGDLAGQVEAEGLPEGAKEWDVKLGDWKIQEYVLKTTKQSSFGPVADHKLLFLFLTIGLGILGGLLYILPKFNLIPGIKHDHIYHSSMMRGLRFSLRRFVAGLVVVGVIVYGFFYMGKSWFWPLVTVSIAVLIVGLVWYAGKQRKRESRSASPLITGWLGLGTGIYLITFYVLLYWAPQHITSWMLMADPLSLSLSGNLANQWFVYGLLYTIIMLVMGVRMAAKYMHNRYQLIRTGSVVFFQVAFAFLIPQFIGALNTRRRAANLGVLPEIDLKNIWPLDYSFFFNYRLDTFTATEIGIWMLAWGIGLIVLGVPVITYFYGKRWYCSWVCGCGGLAETLGDPYRQLSDKSLAAWQYERWIIHGVLVFVVVMTMGVLYSYLPASGTWFTQQTFLGLMIILLLGAMSYVHYRWNSGKVDISVLGIKVGWGVTVVLAAISAYHLIAGDGNFMFMNSNATRQWYGFLIGSAFAGVVGTGFYPLMGNRVWCRFGCPLAAYLGLVQRFKSRFRITTNGGQCISCGNCSTYCEMGIDVRHYAQRGQDVVRSSCVGCGVCAAVCPRGVLRLENSSEDIAHRTDALRTLHVSKEGVHLPT